jgi:hypothetical protein
MELLLKSLCLMLFAASGSGAVPADCLSFVQVLFLDSAANANTDEDDQRIISDC